MTHPLAVLLLLFVLLAVCIFLFRKLLSRPPLEDYDRDWLENYSIARYRPMERLLSEEDYRFLSSQPGYRRELGRKLRLERRRVFRAYLSRAVADFNRLHRYAKAALVSSEIDRPDLALDLLRQRATFYYAVGAAYCRLGMHAMGWTHVPIAGVIRSLEGMRSQALVWSQAGAAA